jgi:hypothetical protein
MLSNMLGLNIQLYCRFDNKKPSRYLPAGWLFVEIDILFFNPCTYFVILPLNTLLTLSKL